MDLTASLGQLAASAKGASVNQIEKLRAERDQKMRELEEKVARGGDDGEKSLLADQINEISDELERLGNSDDIAPT